MTRVVLLGASNLALSFPSIVARLSAGLPGPLTIFAALGHGRSYCGWSRILFRSLPSIPQCDLWMDLADAPRGDARTVALITDVGNDLIYGSPAELIANRVESCLTRLRLSDIEIVMTRLPLASIGRLSALRFYTTKAVFFPANRAGWPAMLESAQDLDGRLAELASRYEARLVEQPLDWYGFDPIHIRRSRRADAWQTIFSGWPSFDSTLGGKPSQLRLHRYLLAAPAERRLFGRSRYRIQPSLNLDNLSIRLY